MRNNTPSSGEKQCFSKKKQKEKKGLGPSAQKGQTQEDNAERRKHEKKKWGA